MKFYKKSRLNGFGIGADAGGFNNEFAELGMKAGLMQTVTPVIEIGGKKYSASNVAAGYYKAGTAQNYQAKGHNGNTVDVQFYSTKPIKDENGKFVAPEIQPPVPTGILSIVSSELFLDTSSDGYKKIADAIISKVTASGGSKGDSKYADILNAQVTAAVNAYAEATKQYQEQSKANIQANMNVVNVAGQDAAYDQAIDSEYIRKAYNQFQAALNQAAQGNSAIKQFNSAVTSKQMELNYTAYEEAFKKNNEALTEITRTRTAKSSVIQAAEINRMAYTYRHQERQEIFGRMNDEIARVRYDVNGNENSDILVLRLKHKKEKKEDGQIENTIQEYVLAKEAIIKAKYQKEITDRSLGLGQEVEAVGFETGYAIRPNDGKTGQIYGPKKALDKVDRIEFSHRDENGKEFYKLYVGNKQYSEPGKDCDTFLFSEDRIMKKTESVGDANKNSNTFHYFPLRDAVDIETDPKFFNQRVADRIGQEVESKNKALSLVERETAMVEKRRFTEMRVDEGAFGFKGLFNTLIEKYLMPLFNKIMDKIFHRDNGVINPEKAKTEKALGEASVEGVKKEILDNGVAHKKEGKAVEVEISADKVLKIADAALKSGKEPCDYIAEKFGKLLDQATMDELTAQTSNKAAGKPVTGVTRSDDTFNGAVNTEEKRLQEEAKAKADAAKEKSKTLAEKAYDPISAKEEEKIEADLKAAKAVDLATQREAKKATIKAEHPDWSEDRVEKVLNRDIKRNPITSAIKDDINPEDYKFAITKEELDEVRQSAKAELEATSGKPVDQKAIDAKAFEYLMNSKGNADMKIDEKLLKEINEKGYVYIEKPVDKGANIKQ